MTPADEVFTVSSITRQEIAEEINNYTVLPICLTALTGDICRDYAKDLGDIDDCIFDMGGDEDEYEITKVNLNLRYALLLVGREGIAAEWYDSLDDMEAE